jgi:phosphoserine phosphatase RsbU/P
MITDTEQIGKIELKAALPSQAIGKIASSTYYVTEDTPIETLFEMFKNSEMDVPAVGIVDENMAGVGAVVRKELISLLSRPFGREVLKKRPVKRVQINPRSFIISRHIFAVSDVIRNDDRLGKDDFYLLHDESGKYQGLFSTRDLLIYLSSLTEQDITLAHSLQTRMVKERLSLLTAELEVTASASTAKGVGGDFYSLKKVSQKDWIISLCDVSGKGVAASIITAMLYGIMETFEYRRGLVELVCKLNRSIFTTFNAEKYLTGIFLHFDEVTAKLGILDMGHSYLMLIRKKKLHKINSSSKNLPVGITDKIDPQLGFLKLERDDMVILVTDGLAEQVNQEGEEYSVERLYRLVIKHEDRSLEEIREIVLADFSSFKKDAPFYDDVTFLLLRYPKEEEFDETFEWEKS